MAAPNEIMKDALNLTPAEKSELIEKLLLSLDHPDKELDELWAKEAEARIEAYDQGNINALTLKKVSKSNGIIYQVRQDEILIVAIANLHCRPGYWENRI